MKNLVLIILCIVVLVLAYWGIVYYKKQKKQDIADYYNVHRDTLANWAKHFPTCIPADKWKSKRIFTPKESWNIYSTWGLGRKVLNKKEIIEKTSSDYPTLSAEVKRKLAKIGITLEAWKHCSVFPPAISEKIIKIMNGEDNQTLNLNLNS